jgi:tetratricopeptide (TPR) repeat protein
MCEHLPTRGVFSTTHPTSLEQYMRLVTTVAAALLLGGRIGQAQTAADSNSYTWLVNSAHAAVDSGEFANDAERKRLYKNAEQYARRAVAANPNDAEGHFQLARAIGRNALTMGTRDRIKYAGEVRQHTLEALKLNPKHAGANHVLGMWNAEVMRLNGIQRMIAKNFLGGQVFGEASWDSAVKYLEQSVALEPNRITHRLDLGAVYENRDQKAKAIEMYEAIAKLPVTDFNDAKYKEIAAERLKRLK